VAAAASLLAAAVPAQAGVPGSPAARATATTPVVVGTYNIRAGVNLVAFKRAVREFRGSGVQVAGLQEIGSNDRNKWLQENHDWGYYRPPALQQNPIIWKRGPFDFLSARGYRIAKARDIGGGVVHRASWATVVRLRYRPNGEKLAFINVHLIHGAVFNGEPTPGQPALFDLFAEQVGGTVRAVRAERQRPDPADAIYVMGDFNAAYEADLRHRNPRLPLTRFGNIRMKSMWKNSPYMTKSFGTFRTSLLDQVWAAQPSAHEAILRRIGASDHWPALATYNRPVNAAFLADTGSVSLGNRRLVPNGVQPGDTENDGPSKQPSMFFPVTGDVSHGYVTVNVIEGTAKQGPTNDFVVDTSSLYDNDFTNDQITVDIVGDDQPEHDENFTLQLVGPVNTVIDPHGSDVTVTIHDND
jgi:endonuclease/exonuclease/phosphatase family metal-dependent hydrolase